MTINDLLMMTRKQREQHKRRGQKPDYAHPYYAFTGRGELYSSTVELMDCVMTAYANEPHELFTYVPEFFL